MVKVKVRGKKINLEFKIKPEAYQKMMALTKEVSPSEIGGLLVCDINLPKIVVEDLLIPEQDASGGNFFADGEKMAELLEPFIEKKPEIWAKAKGWWHSHNTMGVHWSHEDKDNINTLLPDFKILVSIVTNVRGDMLVRVDMVLDNGMFLCIDEIEPDISLFPSKIEKWAKAQSKKINNYDKFTPVGQDDIVYPNQQAIQIVKSSPKQIDDVFCGVDGRQIVPEYGYEDPNLGFIPPAFNDLTDVFQQMFFRELHRKNCKVSKNERKKIIKKLLKRQEREEKKTAKHTGWDEDEVIA
ncbi:hypothetical protein GTO27_03435 [Candidatus Bathyarchaeota archaeon]|nr:hypothetical protein [Candidatus Bathyarchaeota archaeon]